MIKVIVNGLMPVLKDVFKQRNEKREALERRIAALESRPTLEYVGTWKAGADYQVGNFVTHRGSLWHCKTNFGKAEPGTESVCWQLVCKRGADGRDPR